MIYDLIGIGFGPSNMSLNICIKEFLENKRLDYDVKFFEKQLEFGWHSGMQLPNTYLQVSFLKDLVTQRNPRSKYTFLNFLFETERLNKFINIRQFEPTRNEFEEYLKWIAKSFKNDVVYNSSFKRIEPIIESDGSVKHLNISVGNCATNEMKKHRAKNLSVAIGGVPNIPKATNFNHRVVHSCKFKTSADNLIKDERDSKLEFAVVGGGQSAIEMALYLHQNFPNAQIDSIFSNYAYLQSDSSVFVNEVFFNNNVQKFFDGNRRIKEKMMLKNTNYGVVDKAELDMLYKISYEESFMKEKRMYFHNFSKIRSIDAKDNNVKLEIYNLEHDKSYTKDYDYVFLGTGFKKNNLEYLNQIKDYLVVKNGRYDINRDYSLKTIPSFEPKIFLLGHSEEQHGITNTLLSVNALRSKEVTRSLMSNVCNKSVNGAKLRQHIKVWK